MVEINEGLILGVAGLAWIAYRLGVLWRAPRPNLAREVVVNLFFLYMLIVVHLTLFPMHIVLYSFHPDPPNLIPLVKTLHMLQRSIRVARFNILGNLALLAPLGLFLPLLSRGSRRVGAVLLAGFLITLGIELMQYFLAVRVFDVDDILLNTLGAGLGYGLYRGLTLLPGLSPRLDRLLAVDARVNHRGLLLYGLFVLSATLSIFAYQLFRQSKIPQGSPGGPGKGSPIVLVSCPTAGNEAQAAAVLDRT